MQLTSVAFPIVTVHVGQLSQLQSSLGARDLGLAAHENAELPGGEAFAAPLLDPGGHLLGFAICVIAFADFGLRAVEDRHRAAAVLDDAV